MQAIGQLVFQIKQEERRAYWADDALIAAMKQELSFLRGLVGA